MSSSVLTAPRRVLAVLVAAALAFVVLPIAVAQAAVAGTVSRAAADANVFPTDKETFAFSVTNSGAALVGESVNWVRFVLPSDEAGIVHNAEPLTAPAGWTATREGSSDPADTQTVTFRTTSATSAIRPGASQSFTVPAEVLRPVSSDRAGQFTVAASSDGGRTTKGLVGATPDALTSTVRILEVVGTPAATAPAGVTDQSGTGGQDITYGYTVKNYAINAVTVTGALASNGTDTVRAAAPVSVAGSPAKTYGSEKTAPVAHSVTLGDATADRTSVFSAQASATGASAAPATAPLQVQVPALLQLTDLQPKRVTSKTGASEVVFSAVATKTGTPALTVNAGQLDLSGVKIALDGTPLTLANNTARRVDFKATQLSTTALGNLVGERLVNATATVSSVDANGFDAVKAGNVLTDSITIDNLAPDLTLQVKLPVDADGRQQTAAKNGNRIDVSGTIVGLDAAPTTTPGARQLKVVISDGTTEFPVPVTIANGANGAYTFTGSASPAYAATAKNATAKATVTDTAGNLGTSPVAGYIIDNVLPELTGPGFTTTTRSILVTFKDENVNLFGGCDPRHYLVNGVPGLVERVEFPDATTATGGTGTACTKNEAAPGFSGKRVLILRNAMDDTATPQVTYDGVNRSFSGDPVKDGAANDALRRTIDTLRQIAPLAPEIVAVTRNKGAETATRVDSANGPSIYYTRFNKQAGSTTADDLEVSFLGSKNGYRVEVVEVDAAGKVVRVLKGADVVGAATPLSDGRQAVTVPLGDTDGTYLRALRFTASNGSLLGNLAPLNVVLDRVAPALATRAASGNDVTVTFNDVIQSGGEFASDWFGLATTSTGASRSYQAETVTAPNSTSRLLTVPFASGTTFAGVQYRFTSGPDGGRQYLDRAGNALADSRI